MRIAVIGAGISGNVVAYLLHGPHEVDVFEASDHVGGHANTVEFRVNGHEGLADTGFMVFNDRTYPNFIRLLGSLRIASQPSDMSFSVACVRTGLEYQGSSLTGLFAQTRNLFRPRFHRMLLDILRFNRSAARAAESGELDDGRTVGEFLQPLRLGSEFREHYLIPMVAAIWSARPDSILEFPARFLLGFLRNHGLLQLRARPLWKTVSGGACRYVQRLTGPFRDRIRVRCPVEAVRRMPDQVEVRTARGEVEHFDQVVLATHADQALAILADATPAEREVLGAFPYQSNEAVLHTDLRLLPNARRAWASWNYHLAGGDMPAVSVTYDLTRLQRLDTPSPLLLTLNGSDRIAPEYVLQRMRYEHPAYCRASIQAQRRFGEINGVQRTFFCGAYWGYGFHEDGVNSALAVARYFDRDLDSCTAASTRGASSTAGERP
jgi:uncharacterized protein